PARPIGAQHRGRARRAANVALAGIGVATWGLGGAPGRVGRLAVAGVAERGRSAGGASVPGGGSAGRVGRGGRGVGAGPGPVGAGSPAGGAWSGGEAGRAGGRDGGWAGAAERGVPLLAELAGGG